MIPSTETVTLSGSALRGIGPQVAALAELPEQVRLGRIRPAALPAVPRFRAFFDPTAMAVAPPASINRRDRAAAAIARMYKNDQLGCCVISATAHDFNLWEIDSDSGGIVQATDQEIANQYRTICGPGDRGCMINGVLDYVRARGFVMGGRTFEIDGYVAADWTNELEVKVAQVLFGATNIGFDLPQAWLNSNVWDVTSSQIAGGHSVAPIDYDERGVYVSSWGRVYLMTWAAFTSRRWISEYYVILAPSWYGADNLAPSGVDVAGLEAAMDSLSHGVLPPLPDPHPTPPPVPPSGSDWHYTLSIDRATGRPSVTQVI